MSSLQTRSQFFYGHLITANNRYYEFKEDSSGAAVLLATIALGDLTLTEFAEALASAMTLAGTQDYTVVVNRTTGKLTISAAANFSIPVTGTPLVGQSGWPLAGFTSSRTGAHSYVGDVRSGSKYECQYKLFKYISLEDANVLETAAVNRSAQGNIQVISFGDGRRMECEIRLITNLTLANMGDFLSSATGLADARAFLKYIILKSRIEFMEDVAHPETFSEVLLDSTEYDKDGVGFKLVNMTVDIYRTGVLKFSEVIK